MGERRGYLRRLVGAVCTRRMAFNLILIGQERIVVFICRAQDSGTAAATARQRRLIFPISLLAQRPNREKPYSL